MQSGRPSICSPGRTPSVPGRPSGTARYLGIGRSGAAAGGGNLGRVALQPGRVSPRSAREDSAPGSEDTRSASRPEPEAERSIRRVSGLMSKVVSPANSCKVQSTLLQSERDDTWSSAAVLSPAEE
ncbi:unnamed protein product [Gadus morhua 'NCC']